MGEKVPISKGLYTFLVCAQTICYYLVWPTHCETPNHPPHSSPHSPHSHCLLLPLLYFLLSLCFLAAAALAVTVLPSCLAVAVLAVTMLPRCHHALLLSPRSLVVIALAVKMEGRENKREEMKEWVMTW